MNEDVKVIGYIMLIFLRFETVGHTYNSSENALEISSGFCEFLEGHRVYYVYYK